MSHPISQEQLNNHVGGQLAALVTAITCLIETHPSPEALRSSLAKRFSGRFDGNNPDVHAQFEEGFAEVRKHIQRAAGGFSLLRPDKIP